MTDPSRSDRILEDWAAVAAEAQRPSDLPRPVLVRSRLPGPTLASLALVAVVLVVAVAWLGGRVPNDRVGVPPISPAPSATASSPADACRAEDVDAEITQWEGAAGSRIANIELTNVGQRSCTLPSQARLQLVDGAGMVLIDGAEPTHATFLMVAPGAVLTTLVEASNYCGRAPTPRVTVNFLLGNELLFLATPLTASDGTLPPCNGPGSPASIQMQPWSAR